MLYHLGKRPSQNRKVSSGNAFVSRTTMDSCPDTCPFKIGNQRKCYAEAGKTGMHWRFAEKRGVEWEEFLAQVRKLPEGVPFRHNEAGDLPGDTERKLDGEKLLELAEAASHVRGFTYTHYPDHGNTAALREVNARGFAVNVSSEWCPKRGFADADRAMDKGLPAVAIVPKDSPNVMHTSKGRAAVKCPEMQGKVESCEECMLCHQTERSFVITFPVHGPAFNRTARMLGYLPMLTDHDPLD